MDHEKNFSFTYSAQQQKEIEGIRQKYLPKEDPPLEQLRKLHKIPTHKAQTASITMGVIGALIMGSGMSLTMTRIGALLGSFAIILGISVGLVGITLIALAYPLYNCVLKRARAKIAPDILRLSDELLK